VTIVDRMGDAASGTFGVRLSLPNPDNQIPAGLKCDLNFMPEIDVVENEQQPANEPEVAAEQLDVVAKQTDIAAEQLPAQRPATDPENETPAPALANNDGGASHVGRAGASIVSLR